MPQNDPFDIFWNEMMPSLQNLDPFLLNERVQTKNMGPTNSENCNFSLKIYPILLISACFWLRYFKIKHFLEPGIISF